MVHTNSIAIAYLNTDHDHDLLLDRDHLADRGSKGVVRTTLIAIALDHQRNRFLNSDLISMTRALRPSYFNLMSQVPSFLIWYPVLPNSPVDVI